MKPSASLSKVFRSRRRCMTVAGAPFIAARCDAAGHLVAFEPIAADRYRFTAPPPAAGAASCVAAILIAAMVFIAIVLVVTR
jgi:hypothetical protein